MRYRAFATDYDGTLADSGTVAGETVEALARLRREGWRLILVTGRRMEELRVVFRHLELFDRVVAENGALLYRPDGALRLLAGKASAGLVRRLRKRAVKVVVGRTIIATTRDYEKEVRAGLQEMGLDLAVIFNNDALMLLPKGVDKGFGLKAALDELEIGYGETVGIGDAENDLDFLASCGLAIATGNALREVRERAHLVTKGANGAGVREAIRSITAAD